MTQLDKLLSCPFCGWHTPSLKDAGMQRYHVQCPGCGGSGGTCKGESNAERQWNTRADISNKDPFMEEVHDTPDVVRPASSANTYQKLL